MKMCIVCFMLIYSSLFDDRASAQVIDQYKTGNDLSFTNFEIENSNGKLNFKWDVANQLKCRYFEVERCDSADCFKVIALAFPFENNQDSTYRYYEYIQSDAKAASSIYRIKARMEDGSVIYSAVVTPAVR